MSTESAADLLRALRKKEGRTLRSAAAELGVAPSHLSRVERGQRAAGDDLATRMGSYYGLTSDQMLLMDGRVAPDIASILMRHPDELARLRSAYGGS